MSLLLLTLKKKKNPLHSQPHLVQSRRFQHIPLSPRLVTHYLVCDSFLSQCGIYQTDQRQNMSEWNIKTRLSSGFLIARKLTKRRRLHLLTASQSRSKEIRGTWFFFCFFYIQILFGWDSFLRFPLHSCLPCDWCYLSLSSCHRAGRINTAWPLSSEAWSHPKYTPVFFRSAFGHLALFHIIASS